MASKASLENALRKEIMDVIIAAISEHFDLDPETQIEFVNSGTITLPLVDAEGNDKWPTIKVAIPRGTRNGEGSYIPYDGHQEAKEYQEDKEAKAQERAIRKAMKEAEKGKKKEKEEE